MPQRSAEFLKTQRLRWTVVRPSFPPALPACCVAFNLCMPLPAARTVLICRLFQLWLRTAAGRRSRTLCWFQKMERNCDGHGSPWQKHLGCRQCKDGEAKQQRLHDASGGVQQTPAVEGNSKRRRLRFQRTRRAFLRSRTRREKLVREWGNKLGSAIRRRAAALCLSPPSAASADEDDEFDLPYVQLDKVTTTRAVSRRESFGPLYLVT